MKEWYYRTFYNDILSYLLRDTLVIYFLQKLQKSSVIIKRANLKTGVSRKQSTPSFPKNEHFLPPDTQTYLCTLFQLYKNNDAEISKKIITK